MKTTALFVLSAALLPSAFAKVRYNLQGCEPITATLKDKSGTTFFWWDPAENEQCYVHDCGGGRAPPKTVPGCPAYTGTETEVTHLPWPTDAMPHSTVPDAKPTPKGEHKDKEEHDAPPPDEKEVPVVPKPTDKPEKPTDKPEKPADKPAPTKPEDSSSVVESPATTPPATTSTGTEKGDEKPVTETSTIAIVTTKVAKNETTKANTTTTNPDTEEEEEEGDESGAGVRVISSGAVLAAVLAAMAYL